MHTIKLTLLNVLHGYSQICFFILEQGLVLSLDYSSTMALVQLEILNQLEIVTGKRIVDLFEWIVASGVSGFLMMAMVYGKHASNGHIGQDLWYSPFQPTRA